jgi:hypothetical protein
MQPLICQKTADLTVGMATEKKKKNKVKTKIRKNIHDTLCFLFKKNGSNFFKWRNPCLLSGKLNQIQPFKRNTLYSSSTGMFLHDKVNQSKKKKKILSAYPFYFFKTLITENANKYLEPRKPYFL